MSGAYKLTSCVPSCRYGRMHAADTGQAQVIPCADVPYRCDGFDPADWPRSEVPAAVHELAAILARNSARP
jgi:hypothetical protein